MPLQLGEGLLRETFATLRECGAGRKECVVYWAGPIEEPAVVDRVIHPRHIASRGYYEIDPEWLNSIWFVLNERRIEIRVQVHTHGSVAFHSRTDDEWPFLQTAGFKSLVIPRFALGEVSLEGTYLAELTLGGGWRELDPTYALELAA